MRNGAVPTCREPVPVLDGGRVTGGRLGKTVERSVFFLADRANLLYDGPRNIDELWGDGTGQFVDRRVVVVQRQRIMGVRACFPEWPPSSPWIWTRRR